MDRELDQQIAPKGAGAWRSTPLKPTDVELVSGVTLAVPYSGANNKCVSFAATADDTTAVVMLVPLPTTLKKQDTLRKPKLRVRMSARSVRTGGSGANNDLELSVSTFILPAPSDSTQTEFAANTGNITLGNTVTSNTSATGRVLLDLDVLDDVSAANLARVKAGCQLVIVIAPSETVGTDVNLQVFPHDVVWLEHFAATEDLTTL